MRVRILGPMEVRRGQDWERVRAAKQRTLLAMLVINAGRPISVDRLIDELWPDGAVGSAVNQVHGYIWRLRKALDDLDGRLLRTHSPGYELTLPPDQLDAGRFETLAREGTVAGRDGTPDRASALLTEALGLWRGPAFGDVPLTTATRAEAERLDELRLTVLESRLDADLELGRHAELVAELQALVDAEPYRERLCSQLMLALYRSGRQADALAAYRALYERLDDALGVEPSRNLQHLHQQLLASSPELDGPTGMDSAPISLTGSRGNGAPADSPQMRQPHMSAPPRQLPADSNDFTGRTTFLGQLDACLPDDPSTQRGPTLAMVTGPGGVGKTTLAVHWAHGVADRFPGGQLYADLRGHAPSAPRRPASVLRQFLRALGVPGDEIPTDVDEAASLFRSQLADRAMLIVLDNAASARQVRPLLPGNPACLVLVTSRDQLNGLVAHDAAQRVTLPRLAPDESVALLSRIVGHERVDADRRAARELARLCDHLPLALRIVAAQLTADPYTTVSAQVRALADGDRLGAIGIDDDAATNLRASLDLSYRRLAPDAGALFRLAGLIPGTTFTAEAAAALAAVTVPEATRLLGQLVSTHLLERRHAGRYTCHDLVHLYAAGRCRQDDDEGVRDQAIARLLGWYIAAANEAAQGVLPRLDELPGDAPLDIDPRDVDMRDTGIVLPGHGVGASGAPADWLESERSNLVGLAQWAADREDEDAMWLFSGVLRVAAAEVGLGKAHRLANGWPHGADDDTADSHAPPHSHEVCRQLLRQEAEAAGLSALAGVRLEGRGREGAAELLERAIALDRAVDNQELEAIHRLNVGIAYWRLGSLPSAADQLELALEVMPESAAPHRRAGALVQLAEIYRWQGRLHQAKACGEQALAVLTGDPTAEASGVGDSYPILTAHAALTRVAADLGRHDVATRHGEHAVQLAGPQQVELQHSGPQPDDRPKHSGPQQFGPQLSETPRDDRLAVASMARRSRDADTLALLAGVAFQLGRYDEAVDHAERAIDLLASAPPRPALLESLLVLATGRLRLGDFGDARAAAGRAVTCARQQGARAYEGAATLVLADVQLRFDDTHQAEALAREALVIHAETGHRPGEVRAFELLAEIGERAGRTGVADDARRQAGLLLSGTDRRVAG